MIGCRQETGIVGKNTIKPVNGGARKVDCIGRPNHNRPWHLRVNPGRKINDFIRKGMPPVSARATVPLKFPDHFAKGFRSQCAFAKFSVECRHHLRVADRTTGYFVSGGKFPYFFVTRLSDVQPDNVVRNEIKHY